MNFFVGTSGYSYPEWKNTFYPAELPARQMLRYYASQFRSVEINNTFYRMPKASSLQTWATEVPPHFQFVLKAPRRITHELQLENAGESVSYLLGVTATLKKHLGPLLFQLPPYLKKDAARLREFLALLKPTQRVAFEFRHQTWFDAEIFEILREHRAALCVAEAEGELAVPFESTADWGYLRLRRLDYDSSQLEQWARRVRQQAWCDAYVFFKHEEAGKGPQLARRFMEMLG